VVNKKIVHDLVEIKSGTDVAQMINSWKNTQLLLPSMQHKESWVNIDLFIQIKYFTTRKSLNSNQI